MRTEVRMMGRCERSLKTSGEEIWVMAGIEAEVVNGDISLSEHPVRPHLIRRVTDAHVKVR
jgi:hypothetical protein